MPTKMRNVCSTLVAVDHELNIAHRENKLSPKAFLAEAMRICRVDEKRLQAFEKALDDPLNVSMWTNSYINKCQRFIEDATCPNPPQAEKMARVGRLFGSEELPGEMAMLGFDIRDGFCLAVKQSTDKRPERFGHIANLAEHTSHCKRLTDKRTALIQQMQDVISGADISYDDDGAFISGTDVLLKIGWPERLMEFVAGQPRKSRAKLKEAA